MATKPAGKERRRNSRARINRPGRIRVQGGPESHTQLIDISTEGAAFYYASPLERGTDVVVTFHLNMNPETVWVTLQGRVALSHVKGNSNLVRIVFIRPAEEDVLTIREFIKHKMQQRE